MIPAWNEEKSIGEVIKSIPRNCCEQVNVIVIDDCSTDNTVKVAKRAGADRVFSFKQHRGLAAAFKKGLEIALDMNADIIVNIDADGQYDGAEIPRLIKPIKSGEADIVLGSRFKGWIEYMLLQKRVGNKLATFVTKILSGVEISDAQTGFRAFSRNAALRLNVLSDYTYVQETIIQAAYKGLKIVEVPVHFRRRKSGKSRLISNVFSYAQKAGITILRTYLSYKPLKVFVFTGGLIVLLGLTVGLRVILHYIKTGAVGPYIPSAILTVLLTIVGFLTIMLGLIADMIRMNRELHEEILYNLRRGKRK
jgi:glycosyltransferase involved in cell wall biosynthesis